LVPKGIGFACVERSGFGAVVVVGGFVVVVGGTVVFGGAVVVDSGAFVAGTELVVDSVIPAEAFSVDEGSDPPALAAIPRASRAQTTEIPTFQPVCLRLVQRKKSPTGKQNIKPGRIAHQV